MVETKKLKPDKQKVKKWIKKFYGPGKRFASTRALSDAAARSVNTVSSMATTGTTTASAIADICAATGESVIKAFIELGMIDKKEIDELQIWKDLTEDEENLLRFYRETPSALQHAILRVAHELSDSSDDLTEDTSSVSQ